MDFLLAESWRLQLHRISIHRAFWPTSGSFTVNHESVNREKEKKKEGEKLKVVLHPDPRRIKWKYKTDTSGRFVAPGARIRSPRIRLNLN